MLKLSFRIFLVGGGGGGGGSASLPHPCSVRFLLKISHPLRASIVLPVGGDCHLKSKYLRTVMNNNPCALFEFVEYVRASYLPVCSSLSFCLLLS